MSNTSLEGYRWASLIMASIGAFVFGAMFLLVQFAPADFDLKVRDFALAQVQEKVEQRLQDPAVDSAMDSVQSVAGRFSSRLESRIAESRAALDDGLPELVANIIAQACELDCERRGEVEQSITSYYENQIARYGVGLDRLREIVEGEYARIVGELKVDLRIFSGSNFFVLIFAALISVFKGRAGAHLLPFSMILFGATVLVSSWYIFGQNWMLTIIFSDYWGWGYSIFLAFITGILIDIAFLRAWITTQILNAIGSAFSAGPLSPC